MTDFEYGIEWIKPRMRVDTPHRTGMTLEEAEAFLAPDGDYDWRDIFKIVRRPIGDWQDLPIKIDLSSLTVKDDHKPGCRCLGGLHTFPPFVSTDIIGKNCEPNFNTNRCSCGSSAGVNGYCGPNGCYNVPG